MECFMCVLETMKLTEMQGVSTPGITVSPQEPGLEVRRPPKREALNVTNRRKLDRLQYNRYEGQH